MNGKYLFGHIVNDLFELKCKNISGSKQILNTIWGALSQGRFNKFSVDSGTELNITNAKIVSMYSTEDRIKMKVISCEYGYFLTNYARIKPFVIALGRERLFHCFQKYEKDVIRIHTDSISVKEKPTDILTGKRLGHLKLEYEGPINLTGLNKFGEEFKRMKKEYKEKQYISV